MGQMPISQAANSYAEALDEAHDSDTDYPGDETTLIDPATFGLTIVEEGDFWIVVANGSGERRTVRWSSANYFWYADDTTGATGLSDLAGTVEEALALLDDNAEFDHARGNIPEFPTDAYGNAVVALRVLRDILRGQGDYLNG
jgi:hypothetical protein